MSAKEWVPYPPQRFVVLDTETTGLPHEPWARVIELGAVLVEGDTLGPVFRTMVRPDTFDPVRSRKAMEINGYGAEDFYFAPTGPEVCTAFHKWLHLFEKPPCYAWNGNFDRVMLWRSGFDRLQVHDLRTHAKELYARAGLGKFRGLKDACAGTGIAYPQDAHAALVDAKTAAHVWLHLSARVASEGP